MGLCRVLALILAIIATACAVLTNIFPVFKKDVENGQITQTLWYSKEKTGDTTIKLDVVDSLCNHYKIFFQVSEGVAVGAAGIGLMALTLIIAQLIIREKEDCLKCCTSFLFSIAFAACGVCVALLVYGYLKGYCQNNANLAPMYAPYKNMNYNFTVSFYLICVSCALFLIGGILHCCA